MKITLAQWQWLTRSFTLWQNGYAREAHEARKGNTLERLVAMGLLEVRGGRLEINDAGREALRQCGDFKRRDDRFCRYMTININTEATRT